MLDLPATSAVWWVWHGFEPAQHKGAGLQPAGFSNSLQTRETGCGLRGRTGRKVAYETTWITNRSARTKMAES